MACDMNNIDTQLKAFADTKAPFNQVYKYIINLDNNEIMYIVDRYSVLTSDVMYKGLRLPTIVSLYLDCDEKEICSHIISKISLSKDDVKEIGYYGADNGWKDVPMWKRVFISEWLGGKSVNQWLNENEVSDDDM
jgi:hypothetical protein